MHFFSPISAVVRGVNKIAANSWRYPRICSKADIVFGRYAHQLCEVRNGTICNLKPMCSQYVFETTSCFSCQSKRFFWKQPSEKRLDKFRAIDGLSKDWELIYRSPLTTYVAGSLAVSSCIVVLFSCGMAYALGRYIAVMGVPGPVSLVEAFHGYWDTFLMGGAFAFTNLAIFILSSQFPIRIYKNAEKKSYTAVFVANVPFRTYKREFVAGGLKRLEPKGVLPWRFMKYKAAGSTMIILDHYIQTPYELECMLHGNSDEDLPNS